MDITVLILTVLLAASIALLGVLLRRTGRQGSELAELNSELSSLRADKVRLESQMEERLEAQRRLEAERESAWTAMEEERKALFESQKKAMEESFRLLSEQNSAALRRQNTESMAELLKPVAEKFGEFDKSVRASSERAVAGEAALREMIKNLTDQSKSVGDEARNLADALRGRSKVQGDFGEMLLVDLLKNSGLQEGVHFDTQSVLRDEQGHEIRSEGGRVMIPDVIVYYPDDTEVVIDSKVSLTAYAKYMNATGEADRDRYAKEHVDSIRRHVDELKTKDYASYVASGKRKLDYNIMFVPIEGAFRLMLEQDPTLWQRARDANVLIVGQMNLMIVLNMILMSWKQHDQEKNIEEVYNTASALMSQLKGWMDSYVKIGEYIAGASRAYDESKRKLADSNQSVMKKIDRLEKLGLSPRRSRAKIGSAARMPAGRESIIPKELSSGLGPADDEDDMPEAS